MKARFLAVGLGLLALGLILWLFFPLGCFESGGPSVVGPRRGECPENLTHVGLLWPNVWSGIGGAGLLALIVGVAVDTYAWRRLVPPSTRRADKLRW